MKKLLLSFIVAMVIVSSTAMANIVGFPVGPSVRYMDELMPFGAGLAQSGKLVYLGEQCANHLSDVNCDKKFDESDLALLSSFIKGTASLSRWQMMNADCDRNLHVDAIDLHYLRAKMNKELFCGRLLSRENL